MQKEYASELHRFLDVWLGEKGMSWTALMLTAGVGPQRGTDIRRGAIPRPDTLRRIAEAMGKDYEDLARAAGYLNPIPKTDVTTGTRGGTLGVNKNAERERRDEGQRSGLVDALGQRLSDVPEEDISELVAFYELDWKDLTPEEREFVKDFAARVRDLRKGRERQELN